MKLIFTRIKYDTSINKHYTGIIRVDVVTKLKCMCIEKKKRKNKDKEVC